MTWVVFERFGPLPDALQRLWADTADVWFPSNPYRAVHGPEMLQMQHDDQQTTADCQL